MTHLTMILWTSNKHNHMTTVISTCNCKPALLVALRQDERAVVVNAELGKGSHATLANTTGWHCVTVISCMTVGCHWETSLFPNVTFPLFLFPTIWEVKTLVPWMAGSTASWLMLLPSTKYTKAAVRHSVSIYKPRCVTAYYADAPYVPCQFGWKASVRATRANGQGYHKNKVLLCPLLLDSMHPFCIHLEKQQILAVAYSLAAKHRIYFFI